MKEHYQQIYNAVALRVTTRRGSVPGMPWFGSRLHTIKDTWGDAERAKLAEGFLLEAVGDLVTAGKISNVAAHARVDGSTLKWMVSWDDQFGCRQTLEGTQ